MVVSVTEKAKQDFVRCVPMETNKSEPLIKCRKHRDVIKTGRESLARDKSGGNLIYCPGGGRYGGGVNVAQASA